MVSGRLTVLNKLGLHARAAAKVVKTASKFESDILLGNDDREVNAKSIMGVMMLAATQGVTLEVRVEGDDEKDAFAAIESIFNERFGEEE
ncbi:MAG: HPr family phosphocarrier protein [Gammaproteobacteria bacterium]|nr:HPr family phosphocarrier protein [Gammaproteobacteria bacterium]